MKKVRTLAALVCTALLLVCGALFAACGAKKVKMSFVADGVTIPAIEAEAGSAITPPDDPSKEGFVFDGWFDNAEFEGDKVTLPTTMPDHDVTYYGKFSAKTPGTTPGTEPGTEPGTTPATKYTLTFVAEGVTIPAIEAEAGAAITPPDDPVRTGFVFDGWYDNAEFEGDEVTLPTTMPAASKTYYAKFLHTYTVTFHSGLTDATGTMTAQTFVEGRSQALTAAAFGKEGFLLIGWATTQGGALVYDDGALVTMTANADLYGVWAEGHVNNFDEENGGLLFLNGDKAILVRDGGKTTGAYDAAHRTFAIAGGNSGRVFANDKFACYGDHALGEYKLADTFTKEIEEAGATLVLRDSEKATYKDGATEKEGAYVYDAEAEQFSFTADGVAFFFRVETVTPEEDEVNVYLVRDASAGEYTSLGGETLVLDGFGNATYTYKNSFDRDVTENETYAPDEDNVAGHYVYDGTTKFNLREEAFAWYDEDLKGTFTKDAETLVLDGYDGATLNGAAGTFVIAEPEGMDENTYVRVTIGSEETLYKVGEGSFTEVGQEIGTYGRYVNWSSVEYSSSSDFGFIVLDGEGNATLKKSSSVYATGTYALKEGGLENEYTFTSGVGSANALTTDFRLVPHSNGSTVFVQASADTTYRGKTYTNGGDTLALDLYDMGVYTPEGGEPVEGRAKYNSANVEFDPVDGSEDKNFTLSTEGNNTFVIPQKSSDYWANTNRGSNVSPRENDKKMTLDGAGNATITKYTYSYDDYEYYWESFAAGTYALVEGKTDLWQFTPDSSSASKQPAFVFRISGNRYYEVEMSDPATYTNGGDTLVLDGYGNATYTAAGQAHSGSLNSEEEGYLSFEEGSTVWNFRIDDEGHTFELLGSERGTYTLSGHDSLVLDGEGGATLGEEEGEYEATAKGFLYTSETKSFEFRLDGSNYEIAYGHADEYIGANDFTRLELHSYEKGATLYDEFGVSSELEYTLFDEAEHVVKIQIGGKDHYYLLDFSTAFFAEIKDDFIVEGNTVVAYQGEGGDIVLPDGVTRIGTAAFSGKTSITGIEGTGITSIGTKAFGSLSSSLHKIIIHGSLPLEIESGALEYNASTVIFADSLEIALSWYKTVGSGNTKHIGYEYDEGTGTYYNLSNLYDSKAYVLADGRATQGGINGTVKLYALEGSELKLYTAASNDDGYTTATVTLTNGVFTLSSVVYASTGTVTYTQDENKLEVTLGETLAFEYNDKVVADVDIDMYDGEIEFVAEVEGNDYTVTVSDYSASASDLQGTFTSSLAFKEKEIVLTGKAGTENAGTTVTLKQKGPNAFELKSSVSFTVSSTRKTVYSGRYSFVIKSAEGFMIVDIDSNKDDVYKLTVDSSDNTFTLTTAKYTKKSYEGYCTMTYSVKVGMVVYTETETDTTLSVVLQLPTYATSSGTLYDATADYEKQTSGTDTKYIFTNISSPSFAAGYTITVTVSTEGETATFAATK